MKFSKKSRYGIPDTIQTLVIGRVNEELDHVLSNLTLSDMLKYYQEHNNDGQDMYYI